MTTFRNIIFMLLLVNINNSYCAKLPPSFKICNHKSEKFNSCVEKAAEGALQSLKKGYPPLGIYSVDPLLITVISIQQGHGPVNVNLKFTDLNIHGFGDATITQFKSDLKNFTFSGVMLSKKIRLEGQYEMDGKVLLLPIKGAGKCNLQLDNNTGSFAFEGKLFEKNGQTLMKIEKLKFVFDTKKLTMQFDNLFNGNEALGSHLNRFLNENSLDILQELKPAVQETFAIAFKDISNRIFTKVPLNEIFQDFKEKDEM